MKMFNIIRELSKPDNVYDMEAYKAVYKTRSAVDVMRDKKYREAKGLVAAARASHNNGVMSRAGNVPKD